MTPKRRAEALLACNGRCARCGEKIAGPYDVDHRISLFMGGADELENLECLHPACHREKTDNEDAPARAKVKRLIAKADGTRRERRPITGRGFDKTLRKKFNGKVEKR